MQRRYVVTAPYVTVKTMTEQGPKILGLYADAPVPKDAPADWVERHLEAKMIAEVENPAEAASAQMSPIERMEASESGEGALAAAHAKVTEGEKALNRHRGAQKAAETRKENAEQDTPPAPPAKPEGK